MQFTTTRALLATTILVTTGVACSPPLPHLKASVRLGTLSVEVTNQDHQDWRNVQVRLSDKFFCPATDTIAAAKSAVVSLASCTSLSGERFTPRTMAPTNIVVTGVLTEDTGEAIAGFALNR